MAQVLQTLDRPLRVVILVALLAGCATTAQRQYQTFIGNLGSEKCNALQAVVEDRERYGIVAPSRDADEAALRRCHVEQPSGGPSPSQTLPYPREAPSIPATSETSKEVVRLEPHRGVFAVPVINRAIIIPFVLDSGAADVQLPAEVVLTLVRTGTLSQGDFIGESAYVLADGRRLRSPRFSIREMQVGERVVRNVAASVGPAVSSDALLGQGFLSKLPSWTLDNNRHVLVLGR